MTTERNLGALLGAAFFALAMTSAMPAAAAPLASGLGTVASAAETASPVEHVGKRKRSRGGRSGRGGKSRGGLGANVGVGADVGAKVGGSGLLGLGVGVGVGANVNLGGHLGGHRGHHRQRGRRW